MTLRNLLRASFLLALVAAAPAARAGGFSTTNVQLLQGWNFDKAIDTSFAGKLKDGTKTTLTLNHFSTWEYGDNFAFFDLSRGRFETDDSQWTDAYVEWHPRLFVNQLLGQKDPLFGVIRNWGFAGEVNQGAGFYAYMGGLGLDFAVPAGWVLGLNAYYRYDNFNRHGWQVSPFWTVPFSLGKVPFLFTGFIDVNGLKDEGGFYTGSDDGVEIWSQPQLLVDALAPFGGKAGKLYVGVEWWLHYYSLGSFEETSSAPQAMVQWTVF
ncbi:ion channel protein Tsx [Anaeromyxobacter sp. PSR-1]|uniref:ion channel protein Tsx n=1 Tax=unclassified Anaeromyxobacter TaxID=2620896 RepID=UPI0005DB29B3|nr:ion channel protein Tsx [Anaeromyxobacter sp. PSR-1]GAO04469.1 nucleoside-specific channel-forming protein, Tsx [Anaeromyxobacter sp. PSR-1]